MPITCPTCGASYDLAAANLPPGGSHVQCSACHTRWFARPPSPPPQRLSEDEIITRLETRGARAEPGEAEASASASDAGAGAEAEAAAEATAAPGAPPASQPAEAPAAVSAAEAIPFPGPSRPAAPGFGVEEAEEAPAESRIRPAREAPPAQSAGPLRPRAAVERPAAAPPPPPEVRGGGRAWLGALLAFAIAGGGLWLYLRAEEAAARAPQAAPALAAYVERVDATRAWIEDRLGPLRDRLAAR